jgi:aryl-alcohol dehydrogenase-like predicted oxidoreductase
VVDTLTQLIREGKIRYYGLSDTPAWYVARAQTIAEKEGKERIATLQLEYSLTERTIEREHIPVAQELGIGICPWGPLASGFLSGKYSREGNTGKGQGRLVGPNQFLNRFTEHNWKILDVLSEVAKQLGKPLAQIALNWVATQPGITSTILGATKVEQLEDNLAAIEFDIPADLRKKLDEASALESVHPYFFFSPMTQSRISGGTSVQPWKRAYTYTGAVTAPAETAEKKARAGSD